MSTLTSKLFVHQPVHPSNVLANASITTICIMAPSVMDTYFSNMQTLPISKCPNYPHLIHWINHLPISGILRLIMQQWITFLRFGKLGKPLSEVSPLLLSVSVSRLVYWSVRPVIWVASQLSRFNSSTCNANITILVSENQSTSGLLTSFSNQHQCSPHNTLH